MVFVWKNLSHWLTLHGLGWLPEFKMADCESEVHCIRGMAVNIGEITTANPTYSTMTDSLLTPPITVILPSSSAQHRRWKQVLKEYLKHKSVIECRLHSFTCGYNSHISFIRSLLDNLYTSLLAESSIVIVRTTATNRGFLAVTTAHKVFAFTARHVHFLFALTRAKEAAHATSVGSN